MGPEGIEYRGSGDEIESTGPSRLAIDPDGGFHFYDPTGRALWSFRPGEDPVRLELVPLDILNVEALTADRSGLILVEIFFAPVRRRVHWLSYDGLVTRTVELPEGFGLEDGLSGIVALPGGGFALEYEGGAGWGTYEEATGSFRRADSVEVGGVAFALSGVDVEIDGVLVTADLKGFGGLRLLGVAGDGPVVLMRDDVLETSPAWQVLSTVEWYDRAGTLVGSAAIPLTSQVTDNPPGVAMGPDGAAYVLVNHAEEVAIIELTRRPDRITTFESSF